MGMMQEFKEFALKGNVVDMAVGVIIGGAFGGIVKSMIDDMIMPLIGIAGKADFSNMFFGLTPEVTATTLAKAKEQGPVLAYGNFITVVINFLILAFVIFVCIKAMNTAKRRFEKEQAATPAVPTEDIQLLRQIRDALVKK